MDANYSSQTRDSSRNPNCVFSESRVYSPPMSRPNHLVLTAALALAIAGASSPAAGGYPSAASLLAAGPASGAASAGGSSGGGGSGSTATLATAASALPAAVSTTGPSPLSAMPSTPDPLAQVRDAVDVQRLLAAAPGLDADVLSL